LGNLIKVLGDSSAAELDTFGDMSLDQIADVTAPLRMPSAATQMKLTMYCQMGEETLADSEQADDETLSKR